MEKLFEIAVWPLAVVIIAIVGMLIFRSAVVSLFGRTRRAAIGGNAIDFESTQAAEQQKEIASHPIHAPPATVPATEAMPAPSEVYEPIEQQIKNALAEPTLPADVKQAWLIRALAVARVERAHEQVYRTIFGSQIELMLLANTPSAPDMTKAREIFETAKNTFPELYGNFTFEAWANYPTQAGILRVEQVLADKSVFKITPWGVDFLHFLVRNNLTMPKYG